MSIKELKLQKPLLVNGEEISILKYNVDDLTINHISKAEACKGRMGGSGSLRVPQIDFLLHTCIGMQAVILVNPDISEEDLMRLKGYDVSRLAAVGATFFAPQGSSQEASLEKPQEATQNITTVQ